MIFPVCGMKSLVGKKVGARDQKEIAESPFSHPSKNKLFGMLNPISLTFRSSHGIIKS